MIEVFIIMGTLGIAALTFARRVEMIKALLKLRKVLNISRDVKYLSFNSSPSLPNAAGVNISIIMRIMIIMMKKSSIIITIIIIMMIMAVLTELLQLLILLLLLLQPHFQFSVT